MSTSQPLGLSPRQLEPYRLRWMKQPHLRFERLRLGILVQDTQNSHRDST